MPGWEREEEEEEDEAEEEEEGERTSLPLTWAGAPANKYQHFLNYLQRLISCATDLDFYGQFFLCVESHWCQLNLFNVTGSTLKTAVLRLICAALI